MDDMWDKFKFVQILYCHGLSKSTRVICFQTYYRVLFTFFHFDIRFSIFLFIVIFFLYYLCMLFNQIEVRFGPKLSQTNLNSGEGLSETFQ